MAKLPEIPVDLWRSFQNTIFGEKADDIQEAESFRWGVDDSLGTLPPDDGTNWEAEARRLEEEQQRRQEEQRKQIEEQARRDQEDYQRIEEERAVAARANELARNAPPGTSTYNDPTAGGTIDQPLPPQSPAPASFSDTANSLITNTFGPSAPAPTAPPMPEDASQSEQYVQSLSQPSEPVPPPLRNNISHDPQTNTYGPASDAPAELLSAPEPPKPLSFADTANSLITGAFGPESPIGQAASGAYNTAVRGGMPDVIDIARKGDEAARVAVPYAIDNYGVGKGLKDDARIRELQAEASGGDTSNRGILDPTIDPAWAAANPDKAQELDDLTLGRTMTVGGMAGAGGGGGIARDAIDAIKALRSAGMSEAALNAERELAMKSPMTLEQIQQQTGAAIKKVTDAVLPKPPEAPAAANTIDQAGEFLGGMGKGIGESMRRADLAAAEKRMAAMRAEQGVAGAEHDAAAAATPLGKQIERLRRELGMESPLAAEVPNPSPLTAEERALNGAADARAREAPPHGGYLEDPTFGVDDPPAAGPQPGTVRLYHGSTVAAPPGASGAASNWFTDTAETARWYADREGGGPGAHVRYVDVPEDVAKAAQRNPNGEMEWFLPGEWANRARPLEEAPRSGPQPGDNIRLPDGTRARVEAPDAAPPRPAEPAVSEPPTGPQPGDRVRLPDGTRATVIEGGGGAPPTGRPPAPPSGGPPLPPGGGRQLPMPGLPERPPEDLTHVRGFGILQGVDDVGREALERAAERGRQFPKGVPRGDPTEAAVRLGMKPEEVAAKWLRQDTRQASDEVAVLRQGVAASLDDVQAAARKARDGTLSPEDQQAAIDGLVNAAVGGEFLRGGRRAAESAGRALNQFRSAVQVQAARGVYDAMSAAAQAAGRSRVVLNGLKNGKMPNEAGLRQLEQTAATLEGAAGRDLLGEGGEAVRRRARREAGVPEPPTGAPGEAATGTPGKPAEPSFAERWGQLKRAHTAAEEAGDTARAADISDQISALSSEVRADAIDRARKAVQETKKPLTMEEAQRIVDERLGQGPVSRIRREEMDQAKGFTAGKLQADLDRDVQKKVLAALKKHEAEQDKFLADLSNRAHESEWAYTQAENAGIQKEALQGMAQRLRDTVKAIHENPNHPGLLDEVDRLMADMNDVSIKGFEMSSDIKKSLTKAGLQRFAGKLSEDQVDQFTKMLRNIDPDDPRALGNIMAYLRRGHALDRVREFSIANMLSSTATASPLGVNNIANVLSAAAHYGFKLPGMAAAESVRTPGGLRGKPELAWGDVGAAYRAAAGAFGPAIQDAVAIVRHGSTTRQAERAAQLADFGGSHPELMAERPKSLGDVAKLKWGPVGELLHAISTRQLEASDAFWSNILESGNYAALAARKARMTGAKVENILANPLDHMDVLEQAQRMSRYTLLKQRSGFSRWLGAGITASPDASTAQRWGKFAAQQAIPFTTTPLNSVLQLLEYSPAGAVVQGTRAALTKDGFARAELTNKALAGATMAGIGIAGIQATVPKAPGPEWTWITGAPPVDTEKRKALQAQGWQENSVWNPANRTYNSIMGTPLAPVLVPAWALQGFTDAVEKGERKGTAKEWEDWLAQGLGGSAQRLAGSVIEQTFLRSVGDIVQGLGQQGDPSRLLAGEVSRYIPAGSLVAQLARLGDAAQRDPKTVTERVIERTPFRGLLPERQGPLGEDLPNDMTGVMGLINPAPRRTSEHSNPTYQAFQQAGVDIGAPKTEVSVAPRMSVVLSPDEQRRWQTLRGDLLQQHMATVQQRDWWSDPRKRTLGMQRFLADAGEAADKKIMAEIGRDELRRRAVSSVGR